MTANPQKIALSLPWAIVRMSLVILAPILRELVLQKYSHLPPLGAFIVAGICFAIVLALLRGQTPFDRSQPL
jgi:hypothetical protein